MEREIDFDVDGGFDFDLDDLRPPASLPAPRFTRVTDYRNTDFP